MSKLTKIGYQPNFASMPSSSREPEVANALVAIATGFYLHFGGIGQKDYDRLPDWMKVYWKSYEYEVEAVVKAPTFRKKK